MSNMITTDAYGQVTEETFTFLKRHNITPAEWDELTDAYGSDHAAARATISDFLSNDGVYDSWRAMQAVARRG
ncbi:hypothetical protein [Gordonia malaquae]|uniref:hypothetical protein n=1 Tax=Gordonia malaquae TaxID=410332 RepID=UPI0030159818